MITLDDIGDILDNAIECLEAKKDSWEIPALLELEGGIKQRVHRNGKDVEGRLLTDGVSFKGKRSGAYSSIYAKRRMNAGHQTSQVDLVFKGDLIKGYTVGKQSGKNVIDFQDDESRRKAGYMEELYRKEIFRPSEQELDDAKEVLIDQFERAARDCF